MVSVAAERSLDIDLRPRRRILVAEDNPVTKDLLKLLLGQRGHTVDIVEDGAAALTALQENTYDIVLMDFHLPKMDGLEVATSFRSDNDGKAAPRFVAMTSDMKGLLGHAANCEAFDDFMPKPLDLERVCEAIECELEAAMDAGDKAHEQPAAVTTLHPADERVVTDTVSDAVKEQVQALGFNFLLWPEDFDSERLSARGLQASLGEDAFDAILITQRATVHGLTRVWTSKALHALPIVDLTGSLGARADIDASRLGLGEVDKIGQLIEDFSARRQQIHRDLLLSDELGDKLLNRIALSGGQLTASYDPSTPSQIAYNLALDARSVQTEADALVRNDLLEKIFFDRFHVCDRCGSSRFNVREECASCRSPNITEEAYLHHFRCAYQGPESDFRQGDNLVCPKCRHELSHFSVDYDKPGTVLTCNSCGHATSEPAIGLLCLDCHAHYDGDAVETRDVFSYAITDRGHAYLEAGRSLLGSKRNAMRFTELPIELIVALNGELKAFEDSGQAFSLINISYRNEREISHAAGPRQFETARDLFLENLANGLRKQDRVVKGRGFDFALLRGTSPDETREGLDTLRQEAIDNVREDLGVVMQVHGPEDLA